MRRDGQEDPAGRDVPRPAHRGDRVPDGGQADASERRARSRYHGGRQLRGDHPPCPTSRPRPPTCSRRCAERPISTATVLVIDDEAAFRDDAIRDLAWTAAFSEDEATIAAAQWLVWEASQALGARSASIQELYTRAPGARSPASRSRPSTCGRRCSTWPGPSSRPPRRPSRGGHPRARPERADLHVPATDRLRHLRARRARSPRAGGHRSSSRATTTSSTPRSTPPTPRR